MNQEMERAFAELIQSRGISREVLLEALEQALVSAYKKNYNAAENAVVRFDEKTMEIRVYAKKEVVEESMDPQQEISLEEARKIRPSFALGDFVEIEVTPRDFGRIAAQTAKQVVTQRIREAERDMIFGEFKAREGDLLTGIVQRRTQRNVLVDLGKTEGALGPTEQMSMDTYEHGVRIKVYIVEVRRTTKGPQILLSRTHPSLLKRLLELEVPEIYDGVVEIKGVSREPGFRSKVAVTSREANVDPVGACVGSRGARIRSIVEELQGERIDVIEWSEDPKVYVSNALSPAKVSSVQIVEGEKIARVIVPDNQLSLAIGKEGQNARLAARLTGWKIDIKSESQAGDWDIQVGRAPEALAPKVAEAQVPANEPQPTAVEPGEQESVEEDVFTFLGEPVRLEPNWETKKPKKGKKPKGRLKRNVDLDSEDF